MKIEFKIKTRLIPTLFLSIWTILCLILTGILTYALFTSPSRIDGLLIFVFIILILVLFLNSNYIIWQINGKETLFVSKEKIVLRNENTFFNNKFEIDAKLIDNISVIDNDSFIKKFWGVFGGKIIIEYLGRSKKIGKDISLHRAEEIAKQIKNKIKYY